MTEEHRCKVCGVLCCGIHNKVIEEFDEGWNAALKEIEKESIKDNSISKCPRLIISKSVLKSLIK